MHYHTTEKEFLAIALVLEEVCSMLLDAVLFIYTDHKNLTFDTLNCCCMLRWHLSMEEYGPIIIYHPGKKNVITNTFSRLLHCDVLPILVGKNVFVVLFDFASKGLNISDDPDLPKCFLNLPLPNIAENHPVNLKWIQTQQNIGTKFATKLPATLINTSIRLLMVIQL